MSMTPEEKFNHQVWEILQKIKEGHIATEKDRPVKYKIGSVIGVGIIPRDRKVAILKKLQEWKALKIVTKHSRSERHGLEFQWDNATEFELEINQPKFDEIYKKFKKACDLTTYLNEYQNSQLKGNDDLPEFGHLENKKQPQQTTRVKHKGQMFETGSGGGYYNRTHPIRPVKKQSASEIVDGFSPSNYALVLMVSEGILSVSEFGSEGEANYQLQSAPGQTLVRERQLLTKFEKLGLFRNLGEDGIFAIAKLRGVDTSTLKQIVNEIKSRQTKTSGKSNELKARYNQLIAEIRNSNKTASNKSDLEERYQKIISEIKQDTATRRGIEKKWDVLQAIWSVYESNSRSESILVPVARLTIKGRDVELIDGIIGGLKKEGAFQKWDRKDRYYDLQSINHELLPKIYQEVGDTYKELAHDYQEQKAKSEKQDKGKEALETTESKEEAEDAKTAISHRIGSTKLEFYPEDGLAIYKTADWNFKPQGKGWTLLGVLSRNKNTPYTVEEIKEKCNPKIAIKKHHFRAMKDIRDTVDHIKKRLKVNKREYFPILKRENHWIWEEK